MYLMWQRSCPWLPIQNENLDSFKALMPEPLYLDLMKQYLVQNHKEAHEITPCIIEAIDIWAEQAFHSKFVVPVKKVMGENIFSAEQNNLV